MSQQVLSGVEESFDFVKFAENIGLPPFSVFNTLTGYRRPYPEGVLPYMGYIGMCRCEGYGFQAVYSRIGYINQSVWV